MKPYWAITPRLGSRAVGQLQPLICLPDLAPRARNRNNQSRLHFCIVPALIWPSIPKQLMGKDMPSAENAMALPPSPANSLPDTRFWGVAMRYEAAIGCP